MKRIIVVSIGFVLVMGCAKKHGTGGALSGTIRYKGQPVNGAVLHLLPATPTGADQEVDIPIPVTQEGTFRRDSIPPGEYKIVVESPNIPKQAQQMPNTRGMDPAKAEEMKKKFQTAYQGAAPTIAYPNKYKTAATTPLKYTVIDGDQKLDLDLTD